MKSANTYQNLKIDITADEKHSAKALAKSKGMTFQGWLGQLIKRELEREGVGRPL